MLADTGQARHRKQSSVGRLRKLVWGGAPGGAAPTPTGAEASPVSRRGRSQGSAKGGLANLLAPPGAPSPRFEGKEKGETARSCRQNRASGAMPQSLSPLLRQRHAGDDLEDARARAGGGVV